MRPSRDEWALQLAVVTSARSTCCRRAVGCIMTNERGHILSTGYNGVAAGLPHCNEVTDHGLDSSMGGDSIVKIYGNSCSGANSPSGTNLDACGAIHAEQNALLQCRDVYEIHTCYTTTSPCVTCTKLLMNTGCKRIVFLQKYPGDEAFNLWMKTPGHEWNHYKNLIPGG